MSKTWHYWHLNMNTYGKLFDHVSVQRVSLIRLNLQAGSPDTGIQLSPHSPPKPCASLMSGTEWREQVEENQKQQPLMGIDFSQSSNGVFPFKEGCYFYPVSDEIKRRKCGWLDYCWGSENDTPKHGALACWTKQAALRSLSDFSEAPCLSDALTLLKHQERLSLEFPYLTR